MAQIKRKNFIKLLGLILAILISFFILLFKDKFANLKNYGYLSIFLLNLLGNATIILPAPAILATYAGGGIFNPIIVGLLSALGATIGEITGYLAGYSSRYLIDDKKIFSKIQKWMDKYGLWTVFVLAIIPNPFFDVAGIIAGIIHLPLPFFLLVTLAGKTIKFLAVSFLGAGSASVLQGLK
jgi:uncharacterized membrane protein YdjX (TVP38/TMEM64 family)